MLSRYSATDSPSVKFVDRSGSPRSPEKLARELAKLQRQQHRQRDAHRGQHRSLQYTKAARQVLEMALAELCVAAPLDTLFLHDVEESPSSAMLHVTLIATDSTDAQLAVIQPHLKALTTQLRAILAQSVRRRRTPHLRLHLIPGQLPEL